MAPRKSRIFILRDILKDGEWHTRDEVIAALWTLPKEQLLKAVKHYSEGANRKDLSESQRLDYGVRATLAQIITKEQPDIKKERGIVYYRRSEDSKPPSIAMALYNVLTDYQWHQRKELEEVVKKYVSPEQIYRTTLEHPKFAKKLAHLEGEEAMTYAMDNGIRVILSHYLPQFRLEREGTGNLSFRKVKLKPGPSRQTHLERSNGATGR